MIIVWLVFFGNSKVRRHRLTLSGRRWLGVGLSVVRGVAAGGVPPRVELDVQLLGVGELNTRWGRGSRGGRDGLLLDDILGLVMNGHAPSSPWFGHQFRWENQSGL